MKTDRVIENMIQKKRKKKLLIISTLVIVIVVICFLIVGSYIKRKANEEEMFINKIAYSNYRIADRYKKALENYLSKIDEILFEYSNDFDEKKIVYSYRGDLLFFDKLPVKKEMQKTDMLYEYLQLSSSCIEELEAQTTISKAQIEYLENQRNVYFRLISIYEDIIKEYYTANKVDKDEIYMKYFYEGEWLIPYVEKANLLIENKEAKILTDMQLIREEEYKKMNSEFFNSRLYGLTSSEADEVANIYASHIFDEVYKLENVEAAKTVVDSEEYTINRKYKVTSGECEGYINVYLYGDKLLSFNRGNHKIGKRISKLEIDKLVNEKVIELASNQYVIESSMIHDNGIISYRFIRKTPRYKDYVNDITIDVYEDGVISSLNIQKNILDKEIVINVPDDLIDDPSEYLNIRYKEYITSNSLIVRQGEPNWVYEINVKKGINNWKILIDAISGDIIEIR